MTTDLVGRVMDRIAELGMNPRSASLASGLNATFVRDLVKRPNASPSASSLEKLAAGLQTTPEWLAFGQLGEAASPKAMSTPAESAFVRATYGGIVEAGTFREVGEFEDSDREPDYVPRDERYPRADYFIFDVAGDSMNAADPPMPSGSRVVAVALARLRGGSALRTGDVVVIERTRDDGALRERSVKELQLGEAETRFCPRSTNPRHQPIVVPKDFHADDFTEVRVLGLVIDVMMRVRRR